jgi:hypothetical protein
MNSEQVMWIADSPSLTYLKETLSRDQHLLKATKEKRRVASNLTTMECPKLLDFTQEYD